MPLASVLFFVASQGAYHPPVEKVTPEIRAKVIDEIDEVFQKKAFSVDFDPSKWRPAVKANEATINQAETSSELSMAITMTMMDMGYSHTALYALKTVRHVKFSGVGIMVTSKKGVNYVFRVFRGSAAEKAGIRAGEVILEHANLEAKDPKGKPAVLKLRSTDGKVRTLKIHASESERELRASLTPLSKKTAVLEVPGFDDSYRPKELEALIRAANKYENLLIDFRMNSGGRPEWLMHFLAFFEAKGTPIGTFVGKEEADKYVAEHGQPFKRLVDLAQYAGPELRMSVPPSNIKYLGRIAVLIGPSSGSATEIVTQALREYRDAPCVGAATAGAVLLPNGEYLPSGYLIEFPQYDYVSARGRRLEKNPIQPDLDAGEDIQSWPGHPDPMWRKAAKLIER